MKGQDHFFGEVFFKMPIEEKRGIHWVFLYPANDKKIKEEIRESFKEKGFSVSFASELCSYTDLLKILWRSLIHQIQIRRLATKLPNLVLGSYSSKNFPRFYSKLVLELGQNILVESSTLIAMTKISNEVKFKKIIYAFEERSLERAILLSLKENVISYGFIHIAIHDGHICFYKDSNPLANPPRPHKILVAGAATRGWFLQHGHSNEDLILMGSPRAKFAFSRSNPQGSSTLRILLIVSHAHEIRSFVMMARKNRSILQHHQITIRKHPHDGIKEQTYWINRLAEILPNVIDEGGPLNLQVDKNHVVLFSASSGGVEAICLGAIGMYVSLDEFFLMNTVKVLGEHSSIKSAYSVEALNQELQRLSEMGQPALDSLWNEQISEIKQIYDTPNVDFLFSDTSQSSS